MKKIIALLLAIVMVMGLATVVSADTTEGEGTTTPSAPTYEDEGTVTLTKVYKETNGENYSASPAETFSVSINAHSVSNQAGNITLGNMPVPTVDTVSYLLNGATKDGEEKDFTFTLPALATAAERKSFSLLTAAPTDRSEKYMGVGVYTYEIKENKGTSAGVTYYEQPMYLVVTVIADADNENQLRVATVHVENPYATEAANKVDNFENVYSAGDLVITKEVKGIMGDRDQYFNITVTLNGDPTLVYQTIDIIGSTNTANASSVSFVKTEADDTAGTAASMTAEVELKIKHGDEITLKNIPYGVTYSVVEDSFDTYVEEVKIEENATVNAAEEEVEIINTKDGTVDTGVNMDVVPFVVMMVIAVLGVVAITAKKRVQE